MSDEMIIVTILAFIVWLISLLAVLRLFPIARRLQELATETRLLRQMVAAQIPGEIGEIWRCGKCYHDLIAPQKPSECPDCHSKDPEWQSQGVTKVVEITAITVKPREHGVSAKV